MADGCVCNLACIEPLSLSTSIAVIHAVMLDVQASSVDNLISLVDNLIILVDNSMSTVPLATAGLYVKQHLCTMQSGLRVRSLSWLGHWGPITDHRLEETCAV